MVINKIFNTINSLDNIGLIFISPHLYSVGDFSEILMFGLIKAKHKNKKIFLLSPYDSNFLFGKRICNNELLLLESKYIYKQSFIVSHFSKILVTIMMLPSRWVDRLLNIFGKSLPEINVVPAVGNNELWATDGEIRSGFSWEVVDKNDWLTKINYGYYDLSIDEYKSETSKGELKYLGISSSSWYVCLHIRESGFKKDIGRREYRNSNILNYMPAIEEIIKAGGTVVRMGDSTMTKLPKMKNLIDYPFTKYKSALMDLYLIKNCRFYIGTESGIMSTSKLFFKDSLITNMVAWVGCTYPFMNRDRGIYKHVYSKLNSRFLTYNEIVLNTDWGMQNLFGYIDNNYDIVENTSTDIKDAVIEYIDCLDSNDFSLTKKQLEVNKNRVNSFKEIYKKYRLTNYSYYLDVLIKYKYASAVNKDFHGAISESYLKKYLNTSFFVN